MTYKLSAILLLSGYSKRFNYQNKLVAEVKNKALVDYILSAVYKSSFFEVIAVCRESIVIEKVEPYNFKIVVNNNAFKGISESIKLGVNESSKESSGYMFFQGDQIFLTYKDIELLVSEFDNSKIIVPVYNNEMLSPVIFPSSFREELLSLDNNNSGKVIINRNLDKVKLVKTENKNLAFDIDTINDFNKVHTMIQ